MKLPRRKVIFGLVSLCFLILPMLALAQSEPTKNAAENINVKLQVPLPFVKLTNGTVSNLKDYIEGVYKFLIGAGALLAVVMFIVAGYEWMISGGSADKTGSAKKRMWAAAMGLVLALLSFVILQTINEKLVKLKLPKIDPVQRISIDLTGKENCANNPSLAQMETEAKKDPGTLVVSPLTSTTGSAADFLVDQAGPSDKGIARSMAGCGTRFYAVDKTGARIECAGNYCGQNKICINNSKCFDGIVSGDVKWSDTGTLLSAGYLTDAYLVKICGDAVGYSAQIISRKTFSGKPDSYIIPSPTDPIDNTCPTSTFYGYGIIVGIKGTFSDAFKNISADLIPSRYKLVGSDCSQAYDLSAKSTSSSSLVLRSAGGRAMSASIRGTLSSAGLIKPEQLTAITGFLCNLDLTNPSFK